MNIEPWQPLTASLLKHHSADHAQAGGVSTAGQCCLVLAHCLQPALVGGPLPAAPLQRGPLCQRSKRLIPMLSKLRIILLYLLAREMLLKTCSEQYGGFETVQQIFSFPFKVYRRTTMALMMPSNFVWRKPTWQGRVVQRPKIWNSTIWEEIQPVQAGSLRFSYQLKLNLWIQCRKNWYVISCQNSYLFQIYLKNFIGHNFKPCWCWSSAKIQVSLPCSQVIPVCGFWLDLWFTFSFGEKIPVLYFSSK